jgi:uracil-DNA glycosylase
MPTLACKEVGGRMDNQLERLRSIVADRLESLQRAGVMQLPRAGRPESAPASPAVTVAQAAAVTVAPPHPAAKPTEGSSLAKNSLWETGTGTTLFESSAVSPREMSQAPSLTVLRQEVAGCTRCNELATTRTQTVFGVGDPHARLCFLGEAPGADEDRVGEPFVGRGGQLLNKIIEACRLKREDVYILNMLKCRPPGNRNPLPHELANCRPYLERQLDLIRPEFICCLGAVAAQNLLGTTTSISRLRGKLHAFRGAKVVCTFHPAYLLRNPAAKKDAWEDMKFLLREMGVEL